MIKPPANEHLLTGNWLVQGGKVHGDATCDRIEWLLSGHLQKIADSSQEGGWETLYRDPDDGRYWERTYPQSELHGGRPPPQKKQAGYFDIPRSTPALLPRILRIRSVAGRTPAAR